MSELNNENVVNAVSDELKSLEKRLLKANQDSVKKSTRDLIVVQNRLYAQLESLSWLQRRLTIKGQLPPLRGWAASPDVLLHLHAHITSTRPGVVVEFGSGASTLVIADAMRQNGVGKLISIEHSDRYGAQTRANIQAEQLEDWVDLRIGDLEPWEGNHLNPENAEKPSRWYPASLLDGIENVDLLWVDGPPADTCLFSRYPALPALADKLSATVEIWLDDTIRQEERDICERWNHDHGFQLDYYQYEKGLGRLRRNDGKAAMPQATVARNSPIWIDHDQLIQIHQDERVILEYGSAYGRGIASAVADRFIMSVESDRKTARKLRNQQSFLKSSVVIFHAELYQNDRLDTVPQFATSKNASRYLTEIWTQPFFRDPDVVIIAGHLRAGCLATVRQRIRKPTRVLFENYLDCAEARDIETVAKPVRTTGSWAEFELKPSVNPGANLNFLIS